MDKDTRKLIASLLGLLALAPAVIALIYGAQENHQAASAGWCAAFGLKCVQGLIRN